MHVWIGRRAAVLAAVALVAVSAARADGLSYRVRVEGGNAALNDAFAAVSRLIADEGRPPPGIEGLEQRAKSDRQTFETLMRSQGFYDGTVAVSVDAAATPVLVTVVAKAGPLYRLGACRIAYRDGGPDAAPRACQALGLKPGMAAAAEPIIAATERLVHLAQAAGRPAAKLAERVATIDRDDKTMALVFDVDPGPAGVFGPVVVTGTVRTDPQFLARIVPWKQGERYDVESLETYRKRLTGLNLFDTLTIRPDPAAMDAQGATPIDVAVHEAPHHSVALGAKYATDTGPSGNASWENRNLWGAAEDLKLALTAGTLGQTFLVALTLPDRPSTDQTVSFLADTERDTTDAYTLEGFKGLAQLTAPLTTDWTAKAGLGFEAANVNQGGASAGSLLLSAPLSAAYDNTGSLLDPQHGEKLSFSLRPVFGVSGGTRAFVITEAGASAYRLLNEKLVAAAKLDLGSILFAPEGGVPADLRFYAGGGGSVRGYAYQHVAPRDAAGVLIGGRALATASLELRYRAFDQIGIVAFADAGVVSQSAYFADAGTPRVGAGLGLRYFTGFGPLRLDVGAPLNPARGDAPVQIYVSLGQAF